MASLKYLKDWSSEKGAELVEFALTFPLLLLVILGIMDFGLLFQRYEVLTNAAREGARVGVLPGYDEDDIRARVNQYLLGTSLAPATVTTTVDPAELVDVGGGKCITVVPVRVAYTHTYSFVGGIGAYFNTGLTSKTLTARSNMRREVAAVPCP